MSAMTFGDIKVVYKGPSPPRALMRWARNYALDMHGRRVYRVEIDPERNILKVYRSRFLRGPACHYHEI